MTEEIWEAAQRPPPPEPPNKTETAPPPPTASAISRRRTASAVPPPPTASAVPPRRRVGAAPPPRLDSDATRSAAPRSDSSPPALSDLEALFAEITVAVRIARQLGGELLRIDVRNKELQAQRGLINVGRAALGLERELGQLNARRQAILNKQALQLARAQRLAQNLNQLQQELESTVQAAFAEAQSQEDLLDVMASAAFIAAAALMGIGVFVETQLAWSAVAAAASIYTGLESITKRADAAGLEATNCERPSARVLESPPAGRVVTTPPNDTWRATGGGYHPGAGPRG